MLEDEELNSVSITHTTYWQLRGSLTVVRRAFRSYRRASIKNETCLWLTRQVGSAACLPCLNKIVCFGLAIRADGSTECSSVSYSTRRGREGS